MNESPSRRTGPAGVPRLYDAVHLDMEGVVTDTVTCVPRSRLGRWPAQASSAPSTPSPSNTCDCLPPLPPAPPEPTQPEIVSAAALEGHHALTAPAPGPPPTTTIAAAG